MTVTFSSRPVTAEGRARSRASPYEICRGQSGTETGFSPRTAAFPYQYQPTNVLDSRACARCFYQKDKRAKPGILQNAVLSRKSGSIRENSSFNFSAFEVPDECRWYVHSVFTEGRYFALGFVCGALCCDVGTLGQNKAGVWYQSVSYADDVLQYRRGCSL